MFSAVWSKLSGAALLVLGALAWWYQRSASSARKRARKAERRAAHNKGSASIAEAKAEEIEDAAKARRELDDARRNGDRSGGLSNDQLRDD